MLLTLCNAVDIVHQDGIQCLYSCQHGCFTCMQSVVKSHLDAIPEDRKAIEKGGGNAVQKLHEVEKYIRKNKLKVCVQRQPNLLPAHHLLQFLCFQGVRVQKPRTVKQKVCARPKVKGCKIQELLGRKRVRSLRSSSKQFETHDIHVLFMHALDDTCIARNMYKACRQQPEGCHQMTAYDDIM